jgi:hypothetical protein
MKIFTVDEAAEGRIIMRQWRCDNCYHAVEAWLGHDTACDRCGQLYNAFGQRLAERSTWDEPWDE